MAGESEHEYSSDVYNSEDESVMPRDKLRVLARLIHLQEAQRVSSFPFRSACHRNQYLRDSREAYHSALKILELGDEVKREHQDDEVTASAAHRLYEWVGYVVGSACRLLNSMYLRDNYLKKLQRYATETKLAINQIRDDTSILSPEAKLASVEKLLQELADQKKMALEFVKSRQNPSATWWRKRHELSNSMFDDMVGKYQAKKIKTDPSFKGRFEELGMSEGAELIETEELSVAGMLKKTGNSLFLSVYADVAGLTGKPTYANLARVAKGAGAALLLLQVGLIAWDTYSSDHPLKTFTKDSVETIVSLGAGIAGEIVGSIAVTSALTAAGIAVTLTAASAFIFVASIATGIGVAVAVGALAGWLLDKVFESGGKSARKKVREVHKQFLRHHPATEHLFVHIASMPNGDRLARRLTAPKA